MFVFAVHSRLLQFELGINCTGDFPNRRGGVTRTYCDMLRHMPRRFPPPWKAEKIAGGYVVRDANGQSLAY